MQREKRDITADQLWKILIRDFFKEAIEFFAPEIINSIDFTKEYVFLDKELGRIDKNRMYVDNLVKVHWKDNVERWLLIHIEVQSYDDKIFAERMFRYYCKVYFNYQKEIYPIAIYANENKKYMPNEYRNEFFDMGIKYKYKTYRIIEQEEEDLKKSKNIFALVVLASLYTIEANNDNMRADFKRKLVQILKHSGYSQDKRYKLFYFLGCIIKIEDEELSEIVKEELMKELKGEEEGMDITWDDVVRSSDFFKITLKQEKAKAREEAKQEAQKEANLKIARKLLKQGYGIKEVSEIIEVSEKELKEIITK